MGMALAADSPIAPNTKTVMNELFPVATRLGPMDGEPPAAEVFQRDRSIGYLFYTQSVVASVGFSGKPLNIAVGLSNEGIIVGARIVEHHEPILVIGVADNDLQNFVAQYVGRDIRNPVEVSRRPMGVDGLDAVSGATISSVVFNDTIVRSARAVARSRGILKGAAIDYDTFQSMDWTALINIGAFAYNQVHRSDVDRAMLQHNATMFPNGNAPASKSALISELWAGLATPAIVGRNLLGDIEYNRILANLAEGDELIFVSGGGLYSFKGTAYNRTGVFDRLQILQEGTTFVLPKDQYRSANSIKIDGSPNFRESAIFIMPKKSGFNPELPWRLQLAIQGTRDDGTTVPVTFGFEYQLPSQLKKAEGSMEQGGALVPLWQQLWSQRVLDIIILVSALAFLTAVLFFQNSIVTYPRIFDRIRTAFLIFTLVWIGWYAGAQLSVLNVLTFADSLRTDFQWEFFLLEPLVFILWSFVAVALLFWGRGVYCGWLCPFGALQELISRVAKWAKIPQLEIPFAIHERLWPIKYVVFLGLFALALGGMSQAQMGLEVEPFKTAIILHFLRDWRFVFYALFLLSTGLFVERAFCRYLCPLGGALAIPARLRMFDWLKRRWNCGTQCGICSVRCPVQAIHPEGNINPNECIHCLGCQVIYSDDEVCPPLVQRRKRQEKLAATPPPDLSKFKTVYENKPAGSGETND
jgi:transcriptional regulator of nitric oxide reductase/ferredoxin